MDAQRRRIDEEIADIQKQCASWKRCTGAAQPPQASTQEEQTDRRGEEEVVGPNEEAMGREEESGGEITPFQSSDQSDFRSKISSCFSPVAKLNDSYLFTRSFGERSE